MAQGGAKTIRQLRQARGWTQEVLAGRLRVSKSTIAKWETGVNVPASATRQRLAEVFGVSVDDIALGPAEQSSQETHQHGLG